MLRYVWPYLDGSAILMPCILFFSSVTVGLRRCLAPWYTAPHRTADAAVHQFCTSGLGKSCTDGVWSAVEKAPSSTLVLQTRRSAGVVVGDAQTLYMHGTLPLTCRAGLRPPGPGKATAIFFVFPFSSHAG